MTEIITQVADSDKEVYLVRYRQHGMDTLWAFVYHGDPGLDYAVDPRGYTCTGIWDPHGPGSHPRIPAELIEQLDALLNAFA